MKCSKLFLGLAATTLSFGSVANAGIIADAAGDYVDENTLGTGWSYFYSDAASAGTEVALAPNTVLGAGSGVGNAGFGGIGDFTLPAVLGSVTAVDQQFEIFADGFDDNNGAAGRLPGHGAVVGTNLVLHPSADAGAEFLILRYTIQDGDLADGSDLEIEGGFLDNSGRNDRSGPSGSVIASVYVDGISLFSATGGTTAGALTAAEGAFDFSASGVTVGSTVDFILEANGNSAGDETSLQATITTVPEPSAMALIGLGSLALVRRR